VTSDRPPRRLQESQHLRSESALAVLSVLSRRLSRAAFSDASAAGVFPSLSGTAPPGALRAKRTPVIAVATPVAATATTAASLLIASARTPWRSAGPLPRTARSSEAASSR
jgi:hypothetical protein